MPYLDMLDNPIAVGDTIVYPAAQGSSAAAMKTAEITEIIDIYPQDPSDPKCRRGYTRTGKAMDKTERHLWHRRNGRFTMSEPTFYGGKQYGPYKRWEEEVDPDRLYLLRVKRVAESDDPDSDDRPGILLKNVDRIVAVSRLLKEDA